MSAKRGVSLCLAGILFIRALDLAAQVASGSDVATPEFSSSCSAGGFCSDASVLHRDEDYSIPFDTSCVIEFDQWLDYAIFFGFHQIERFLDLGEGELVSRHRRWIDDPFLEEPQ